MFAACGKDKGNGMKKRYWIIFLMVILLGGCAACGKRDGKKEVEDSVAADPSETGSSAGLSGYQGSVREDVVFSDGLTEDETDVVIVMDRSGSMAYADKDRIAIEAAKMFIDMEKASGANLALVEFSNEITSTELIEIKQEENKTYLKELLDNISYGGKAHTDTGAALKKAVSILNSSENKGKKAIILFTDGRTDIDIGTPGRTTEDSLTDVNAAIEEAGEQGYPVYSVGLNANGSVDESELARLASNTGGDYRIAQDVSELPDFFNQIFMEMRNIREIELGEFVADGDYEEIKFKIDSGNIIEANIVILHGSQLEDIKVFNPDGEEVTKDDQGARFSTAEKYTVIKLLKPQMDEWKLQVKGVSGDSIRISLLYHYDFTVTTVLSSQEINRGDTVDIDLYLNTGGESIKEEEFYQGITVEASVENMETGERSSLAFAASAEGLHSEYTPDREADYAMQIHLEGDGFYRDVDGIMIHVRPDDEEIAPAEELAESKEEYEAETKDAEKEGMNLLPIIAAVVAIVLILLILALRKAGRRIDGKFTIGVKCRKEENGATGGNDYSVPVAIEGRNLNSSRMSLEELLKIYQRHYDSMERDGMKKQELKVMLSDIKRYTKQVLIIGDKKSGYIRIRSKAGNMVKICDAQGMEKGKSVEIGVNNMPLQGMNECRIRVAVANGYVEIAIRYSMV